MGSLPTPAEIAAREHFVVINEKLWRGYFGGRLDIVARAVTIDGQLRRVIGVMPSWFTFPQRAQVGYPLEQQPGPNDRWLAAIGELAPGKKFSDVQPERLVLGAGRSVGRPPAERKPDLGRREPIRRDLPR